MNKIVPTLAALTLVAGMSSAYAIGGPIHMPGYNDGEGSNVNNADQYARPMAPRSNSFTAFLDLNAPSATQPAPNGTVNQYSHEQTNGYPGQDYRPMSQGLNGPSAFYDSNDATQPAPNGTVNPYTHQQTNGFPGQDANPSNYRSMGGGWNGSTAFNDTNSPYATEPAPNGTVNPYTHQQTNGY